MSLEGLPVAKLGSLVDRAKVKAWYRTQNIRIFETVIAIYSNAISVNPDITKKIQKTTSDYMDLIIPGTSRVNADAEKNFAKQQEKTLNNVFAALSTHNDAVAKKALAPANKPPGAPTVSTQPTGPPRR